MWFVLEPPNLEQGWLESLRKIFRRAAQATRFEGQETLTVQKTEALD